ncbi:hypothetical protein C8F04DRAFT_1208019 [Mycena alexandri]|uniref:GST N-terminal domain-containing protein n=1 Tax=Mycena alexandri TaxID=1745969 RepID=A0AAD6XC29_9AGAR|nr:hypothetical protein C8F04DRAFT_1208019 [Mycena alexandri]
MAKTLYVFAGSVWAAAAELATAELYPEGTIETKSVNLVEGENFDPAFLKLNPNGTLPTLEADGKVYTSTADVVAYLAKESSTNVKAATEITTTIHEQKYDPNFAMALCRNDAELSAKGTGLLGMFVSRRHAGLEKYAASADGAQFKAFYEEKLQVNGGLLAIIQGKAPEEAKTTFFTRSTEHFENLKTALFEVLPGFLPGSGFIGGDVPGEDDYHVGAWLTRIGATTGAKTADEAAKTIEATYGAPAPAKVLAYWGAWTTRPSWKKVYANGLH